VRTDLICRDAAETRRAQKEIVLKALEPEERALSVAGDCFLSARLAEKDRPLRLALVRLGAEQLVKHFPAQVKYALAEAGK